MGLGWFSTGPPPHIIKIDDKSGEIALVAPLDYEKRPRFEILAVPIDGGDGIQLEISEFARIGAALSIARGLKMRLRSELLPIQKYRIAQGNVNNVFKNPVNNLLKISVRPVNGELYADLVVNGQLDREYRDKYELIVEAIDGGKPAKVGRLLVHIFILDANDNAPIFSQPRYSITVPANLTIGSQLLTLKATDADVDSNGRVGYRFQKTRFDTLALFALTPNGILSTAGHLLPASFHDLVVVAYDGGVPSLETTAIVTVTVQVYLLLACGLFDRETSPEYHLKFSLRRGSELVLDHPVLLTIGDINDNSPSWPHSNMHITLNRSISESDQTTVLTASDPDEGINGRVRYSILDTDFIAIDPDTGRLSPLKELDCSLGSEVRFKVRATDGGAPSLYSDLQVIADLVDGYGRPPQFEKSLYEVQIAEDSEIGTCLLKVLVLMGLSGYRTRHTVLFALAVTAS
ncbi:cadherin domain protein [Ostertagia ostertagi]